MTDNRSTAIYLITPPRLEDPAAFAEGLKAALDAGGADCVQLRLKNVDDDSIRRIIDILRPVTQERDVPFVMNDRPDLTRENGCDGVHVGQDDASYAEARALLGPDAIIGVTCKDSRHLAIEAGEAGADYVRCFLRIDNKDDHGSSQPGRSRLVDRDHYDSLCRHRWNHARQLRAIGFGWS
jgi:thiamine-phosphate pyrophosphorylase